MGGGASVGGGAGHADRATKKQKNKNTPPNGQKKKNRALREKIRKHKVGREALGTGRSPGIYHSVTV